ESHYIFKNFLDYLPVSIRTWELPKPSDIDFQKLIVNGMPSGPNAPKRLLFYLPIPWYHPGEIQDLSLLNVDSSYPQYQDREQFTTDVLKAFFSMYTDNELFEWVRNYRMIKFKKGIYDRESLIQAAQYITSYLRNGEMPRQTTI